MSYEKRHMNADSDLYRAVLSYDYQENKSVLDPTTRRYNYFPVGPVQIREFMIGPYLRLSDIKTYMTRHRNRKTNLQLVRVEKATAWEEVEL